jgi:hypothetical protein
MSSHHKSSHTSSTIISPTSPLALRHAKLNQRVVIRRKMRKEKTFFHEEQHEDFEEESNSKGKQSNSKGKHSNVIRQWALTNTEGFVGRYEDKLKINMARKSGKLRRLSLRGPERMELNQSATFSLTSPTFFPNTTSLCRLVTEPTPNFRTTALTFSNPPLTQTQQTITEYVYRRLSVKRNY